ncbi:MAG: ADP-ribosylglycohydrolase family protein [Spirochaetales bacterium]|jgi:ADP-ribosylglycohydrolase|nr:ADP-ribosylglycohydrolase family protein [Spirochaetales bacterium]
MEQYSNYPGLAKTESLKSIVDSVNLYAKYQHELGSDGIEKILDEAEQALKDCVDKIRALPIDKSIEEKEPDDITLIHQERPQGPRKIWNTFDEDVYREKLTGALYSRLAGCVLGSIVEFWPIDEMENWAKHNGDAFPPQNYWSNALKPYSLRYNLSPCSDYTQNHMDGCPVDDDIMYTLLGLLIVEDHGNEFRVADVAEAWGKYLPYACTAEKIALENIEKGVSPELIGDTDNPCNQWIGADIRSDPFAYMAPGYPEKAAQMAYNDAYISHRRNGIYGEMFFAAAQSAAFTVDNAVEALRIGLTEIPHDSALAGEVRWALEAGRDIHDYKQARDAVDVRYKGMHRVHTINNAVLTIWGLMIGGNDMTKVISETVAMGLDNDCTAATAGSIIGAIVGKKGVPEHWYKNFNNKVYSYLNIHKEFAIDDLVNRFATQAKRIHSADM